jgi:phosphate transport system protein
MAREKFEQDLAQLQQKVVELGGLAEEAVAESVAVLQRQDMGRARALIEADRHINETRFALESEALVLIATQQPMASDLRALAAVLEIATELERIADYAKGIANITLMIGRQPLIKPLVDIPRMAALACSMLRRSLDAYLRADVKLAAGIPEDDAEVDALYEQVYRELITHLLADPKAIEQAMRLTWVAHNLERVADRVGNICERVVFSLTGSVEEMTDDSGPRGGRQEQG